MRDPYRDGLYAMLQRADWSEAEFIALGEREGVFVKGAIQTLDRWMGEVTDGDYASLVAVEDSEFPDE